MAEIVEIIKGLLFRLQEFTEPDVLPKKIEIIQSWDYSIQSSLQEMSIVLKRIEADLRIYHFPTTWMDDLIITLSEVITNAIVHGNKMNISKAVKVTVALFEDEEYYNLFVFVQDEGHWRTIQRVKLADFTKSDDLLKASGRGLAIITSLVDLILIIRGKVTGFIIMKKSPKD